MDTAPLAAPATAQRLRALRDAGVLSEAAYDRALTIAAEPLPRDAQSAIAARAALILGGLFSLAAVVFFVAHNWGGMSRWARFGILELGFLTFAAAAWRATGHLTRQIALTLCAAMLGPLLAVYGQTYQTGADPYELFLSWALLAAPIAALARFMPLWAGIWGLLSLSAGLWCEQLRPFGPHVESYGGLVLAAVSAFCLAGYELASRRSTWLGPRTTWFHRALAAGVLLPPLPIACWYLARLPWLYPGGWGVASAACVAGSALALAVIYRRDRFIRSVGAVGAMGMVTAVASNHLWRAMPHTAADVLLGLLVVAQLTLAASWIRRAEVKA